MSHYYYITPEEMEQAAAKGISRRNISERQNTLNWSKQRTITEPVRKKNKDLGYWVKIAEDNGICRSTFDSRIYTYGYSYERAATEPIEKATIYEKGYRICAGHKVPLELIAQAEARGISYPTMTRRIRIQKMTPEEAAIAPLGHTSKKRTKESIK